jgi:DNA helicase-2/ATP-dependent DNA helicase PcrA
MGQASVPSRFLLEIPPELMVGPQLDHDLEEGGALDLDLVFGARRTSRFGTPIRSGGTAYREGSGRPGAPAPGTPFRPTRDLAAKRDAFAGGARSGSFGRRIEAWDDEPVRWTDEAGEGDAARPDGSAARPDGSAARPDGSAAVTPGTSGGLRSTGAVRPRPIVPGERRFRDGDRVRHPRFGDGIVVTSKLTRSDEEVTVAFRDTSVGRKTLLASIAGLELVG